MPAEIFLEIRTRLAIEAYGEQPFLTDILNRQIQLQITEAYRIMVGELL